MFEGNIWIWVGFLAFVFAMLAIDLGVFNRKAHAPSFKEATAWTTVWVSLALVFAVIVYFWQGSVKSLEYLTGYVIEYSLSVDNIFVFVLLFTSFRVPAAYQHRVLFWGILGALIMRGTLIVVGATLLERFHWIIYVFGAFLIFTGIRMAFHKEETEVHPEGNVLVRLLRRFLPVTKEYHGEHFVVREAGRLMATPLLIVLLIVESTDLIFAVDSIPAIFAVTTDPFIVFTSNVFAILGLRSLYFLLANVVEKFYYLKPALSIILTFVGIKMLTPEITYLATGYKYHIPIAVSLSVIVGVLAIAIFASWMRARRMPDRPGTPAEHVLADQATES
ncbi:MAG TPA: TerC family protein [Roseiflexaceae bacterium]|nr:TerC family protein [Roseiflexaceae bacterium]